MSKNVNFYTICLKSTEGITNYSISNFLKSIDNDIQSEGMNLVRYVNNKYVRVFPFYYVDRGNQFVIPFGKLKSKNPYWVNSSNDLEEVPEKLFDINSLAYDPDYDVMLFTTNKEGPTIKDIQEYLNTFIPPHIGLKMSIEPIMYNTGIEKVRNAELVKGVTLTLDLGYSLNNFYIEQIAHNQEHGLIKAFKNIAETVKDEGDGKVLTMSLGLGRCGKKSDTLNLESIVYLLEQINISQDFVREIVVSYKNGTEDKIDTAKLKNTNLILSYNCICDEYQVSPISLLNNVNNAVADKISMILRHIRENFANRVEYNGEKIKIVKMWNNNMY